MLLETATGSVLNWVDLLCLVLLGAFLVYGIVRGFMLQLMGIGVLVASIFLGTLAIGPFGGWIKNQWPGLTLDNAKSIAFVTVFLGVMALGTGLSHLLKRYLQKAKLLAHDRLLGAVLGVVKGWLLAVLLLQLLLYWTLPEGDEPEGISAAIISSRSGGVARWSTEKIFVFLPPGISDHLRKYDRFIPKPAPNPEPIEPPRTGTGGEPKTGTGGTGKRAKDAGREESATTSVR